MRGRLVPVRGYRVMSRNRKVGKVGFHGKFQNERIDLAVAVALNAEDILLYAI